MELDTRVLNVKGLVLIEGIVHNAYHILYSPMMMCVFRE